MSGYANTCQIIRPKLAENVSSALGVKGFHTKPNIKKQTYMEGASQPMSGISSAIRSTSRRLSKTWSITSSLTEVRLSRDVSPGWSLTGRRARSRDHSCAAFTKSGMHMHHTLKGSRLVMKGLTSARYPDQQLTIRALTSRPLTIAAETHVSLSVRVQNSQHATGGAGFAKTTTAPSAAVYGGGRHACCIQRASVTESATALKEDIWKEEEAGWGPAALATMNLLEWRALCEQVSSFTCTHGGKQSLLNLRVPFSLEESERLMADTRAANALEYDYVATLDFGGIQTSEAQTALSRASKGGILTGLQLRGLCSCVEGCQKLRKTIIAVARGNEAGHKTSLIYPLLSLFQSVSPPAYILTLINAKIDQEGSVKDVASEALRSARGRISTLEGRLNGMLKGMVGEVSEQGGRKCLAVALTGQAPPKGVVLGSSSSGSMMYIEPVAAVHTNNELQMARGEARAAEEAVLYDLTGAVIDGLEGIKQCLEVVIHLDSCLAKARYGRWLGGVMPELVPFQFGRSRGPAEEKPQEADDKYLVRLRQLQHPLLLGRFLQSRERLERQMKIAANAKALGGAVRKLAGSANNNSKGRQGLSLQEQMQELQPPVPIDVLIKAATRVVVITGPNTGGKTAALKAMGLLVLMAKCGLPVPAAAPARLPYYTAVLADIGDEQSLTANLSTFSGHLKRIQGLRAEADGRSLILLDELGTGTDPTEGAALGVAIIKKLADGGYGGGALTLATTHHSAMTGLKYQDPRFENASMEFDEVHLSPTYRLLWGVPGRSNALNIAARLGLDATVVEAARQLLGKQADLVNSAVADLEAERQMVDQEENLNLEIQERIRLSQQQISSTQSQLKRELAAEKTNTAAVLAEVLEQSGRRLQAARATKLVQKKVEQQAAAQQLRATKAAQSAGGKASLSRGRTVQMGATGAYSPRVGDWVTLRGKNKQGKVVALNPDGSVVVQVDSFRLTVKAHEVAKGCGR